MAKPVIEIQSLSKKYDLGIVRPKTLRDAWDHLWNKPISDKREELWALKDVSFEVQAGEVIGIVGRNGAGKSTLLKILSRITEPTSGRAVLRGRVSSLLEVGTGFHPELSGRENIYLNGTILGMRKSEIDRKFDEIVAFSEIEKFIDTPVKHYSSGMYVRLAFAVAAHLDPEILLVDEVLAVGDIGFQKKSFGKITEMAHQGRTILFISHDMRTIDALTQRALFLETGSLKSSGPTREIVQSYFDSIQDKQAEPENVRNWKHRSGSGEARIVSCEALNEEGIPSSFFRPGHMLKVQVGVEFSKPLLADIAVVIETDHQIPLFTSHLSDHLSLKYLSGIQTFTVEINPACLRQGRYGVSLAVFSYEKKSFYDVIYHFPLFRIEGHEETAKFPADDRWGPLYFNFVWEIR